MKGALSGFLVFLCSKCTVSLRRSKGERSLEDSMKTEYNNCDNRDDHLLYLALSPQ